LRLGSESLNLKSKFSNLESLGCITPTDSPEGERLLQLRLGLVFYLKHQTAVPNVITIESSRLPNIIMWIEV